jgi:hypothetical protein
MKSELGGSGKWPFHVKLQNVLLRWKWAACNSVLLMYCVVVEGTVKVFSVPVNRTSFLISVER